MAVSGKSPFGFQWRKNGTAISGATSATYTVPVATSADNGAKFAVVVSNSDGSATSDAATLTVSSSLIAPSIVTQPTSQTVTATETAIFSVSASGTAPLTYQWEKNGTAINGATFSSYTTPATTASDNDSQFTVMVTNSTRSVTSNAATLTVTAATAAPAILTQPTSQTVTATQTATFSVSVSGTTPLTYQWRKNGTAISGAISSTYTTPITTSADSGAQFTVVVTNSINSATSNAATLIVKAPGQLAASTMSLNYGNVPVGSSSILSVTLTNTGSSSVSISSVTLSGAGVSTSGISSGLILAAGSTAALNVTFSPSASGNLNGSVTINSTTAGSTVTISLLGMALQSVSPSLTIDLAANSSNVSGFNVYRSSVSGGPYAKVNSAVITSATYMDSTVLANQTYFYVGTSLDSIGDESLYSNEVAVTVPKP